MTTKEVRKVVQESIKDLHDIDDHLDMMDHARNLHQCYVVRDCVHRTIREVAKRLQELVPPIRSRS